MKKTPKKAQELENIKVGNLLSFGVFREISFMTHYYILFNVNHRNIRAMIPTWEVAGPKSDNHKGRGLYN